MSQKDFQERYSEFMTKIQEELLQLEFRLKQVFHPSGHSHITSQIELTSQNIAAASAGVNPPVNDEQAAATAGADEAITDANPSTKTAGAENEQAGSADLKNVELTDGGDASKQDSDTADSSGSAD